VDRLTVYCAELLGIISLATNVLQLHDASLCGCVNSAGIV
jgi:hypothetical protein